MHPPRNSLDMDLEKKEEVAQIECVERVEQERRALSAEDEEFLATFDEAKKRKMYRKLDIRILPMLGLLYLFSCA